MPRLTRKTRKMKMKSRRVKSKRVSKRRGSKKMKGGMFSGLKKLIKRKSPETAVKSETEVPAGSAGSSVNVVASGPAVQPAGPSATTGSSVNVVASGPAVQPAGPSATTGSSVNVVASGPSATTGSAVKPAPTTSSVQQATSVGQPSISSGYSTTPQVRINISNRGLGQIGNSTRKLLNGVRGLAGSAAERAQQAASRIRNSASSINTKRITNGASETFGKVQGIAGNLRNRVSSINTSIITNRLKSLKNRASSINTSRITSGLSGIGSSFTEGLKSFI